MSDKSQLYSVENTLDMRICPDGISYAVSDDNQQILLRQELNIPIGPGTDMGVFEHFFSQPELQILGENVSIFYESNQYQLIPGELFSENDLEKLFSIEHGVSENEIILYKLLPKWGASLAFRISSRIQAFFEHKYPEAVIEHHISLLLKKQLANRETACWLNIRKEMIDLIVIQNKQLQLLNSYPVRSNEDCCYYVLNVFEQLQLDTETFCLKIMSENTVNEQLLVLLKQYVRNVEIIK